MRGFKESAGAWKDLLGDRVFSEPNIYRPHSGFSVREPEKISLTCPHCGKDGIFDSVYESRDILYQRAYTYSNGLTEDQIASFVAGLRFCPNAQCHGLVTVIAEISKDKEKIVAATPPSLIRFRAESIPTKIADSLKEAVASNGAQAYRASVLMVRRALELLCQEKGATGPNLSERIKKLSNFATLPPILLEAADEIRILGNDAAHVEARDYDDITKEHSDVAIELAKRILEAVYQHDDLVAKLRGLKKVDSGDPLRM